LVTPVAQDVLVFEELSAASTVALAEVLNPFVGPNDQVIGVQRTRPAFAATFEDAAGEQFTVAVNHFKAKSDSNLQDLAQEAQAALDGGAIGFAQADINNLLADPNYDQGDGQSFWNGLRTETANELAAWLTDTSAEGYSGGTVADPDFLIVGDLNSYAQEDPLKALEANGFTDLAQALDSDPLSFVFSGQTGTLDYAMANASLSAQVSGTTIWNINADEPLALDYNTDFGRDVSIFDGTLPYRASDHDPVVVGLQLAETVFADGFEPQ
jgi:predicted extracellular nuclease